MGKWRAAVPRDLGWDFDRFSRTLLERTLSPRGTVFTKGANLKDSETAAGGVIGSDNMAKTLCDGCEDFAAVRRLGGGHGRVECVEVREDYARGRDSMRRDICGGMRVWEGGMSTRAVYHRTGWTDGRSMGRQ